MTIGDRVGAGVFGVAPLVADPPPAGFDSIGVIGITGAEGAGGVNTLLLLLLNNPMRRLLS